MKIVICEDNQKHLQYIYTKLKNYSMIKYPSIEFSLVTSNPKDILTFLDNDSADCYFMDIDLGNDINGLELASKIRETDPKASIIFVTTHAELLQLTFTYKIAALDFVIKKEKEAFLYPLIEVLDIAFKRYTQLGTIDDTKYFQVKIGELIKNVPYDDIFVFSTSTKQMHKIQLEAKNSYYEFYGKLKTIENLDDRFYRCHKSFIINLKHVQEINKQDRSIIMSNGSICPISFRNMKELQNKLLKINKSEISSQLTH